MTDVPDSDWEQPNLPPPRPDPIQPGPRNIRSAEGVALRDYMEFKITAIEEKSIMRVEALGKELSVAMNYNEMAVNKAEADMTRRLEGMNEFREQLNRQAGTFSTKNEMQSMRDVILMEIKHLRTATDDKIAAQWRAIYAIGIAVAGASAALALMT